MGTGDALRRAIWSIYSRVQIKLQVNLNFVYILSDVIAFMNYTRQNLGEIVMSM